MYLVIFEDNEEVILFVSPLKSLFELISNILTAKLHVASNIGFYAE